MTVQFKSILCIGPFYTGVCPWSSTLFCFPGSFYVPSGYTHVMRQSNFSSCRRPYGWSNALFSPGPGPVPSDKFPCLCNMLLSPDNQNVTIDIDATSGSNRLRVLGDWNKAMKLTFSKTCVVNHSLLLTDILERAWQSGSHFNRICNEIRMAFLVHTL